MHKFFPSRWGDDAALTALGDLALERGDYEMACSYWRRLHPQLAAEFHASLGDVEVPRADVQASSAATRPERFPIVYPDAEISLPELRPRMILASLLSGSVKPAANQTEQFRAAHPQAQGFLAGRRVVLADALGELLQQARAWPTPAMKSIG